MNPRVVKGLSRWLDGMNELEATLVCSYKLKPGDTGSRSGEGPEWESKGRGPFAITPSVRIHKRIIPVIKI